MLMQHSFDKFKCDKGNLKHRYDRVYEPALKHLKKSDFNMLEIGIFKGNGLESWLDYFSKGHIMGIDIFTRVEAKNIPILNHKRVSWCEQNSLETVSDKFIEMSKDKFDVIIDDGLHTHDAQRITFENLIPFLKNDGVYFIEDVWPFDIMTDQEKKHPWLISHSSDFSDSQYRFLLETLSDYTTIFHDLRNGYDPDTYIIEIRK